MPRQSDTGFIIEQISPTHRHIRMPDELIARMDWVAVKNRISFSDLLIQCCNYALEHMKSDSAGVS